MSSDNHWQETWKEVVFDFEFTNQFRLEVSNWGRIRSFNKLSSGNILNGSITEGYRVVRLKLYKPRTARSEEKFDLMKKEISALYKAKNQQLKLGDTSAASATLALIYEKKKILGKQLADNLRKRTINHHFLIHRLVAQYFLPAPAPEQTIVGHLNYDKLNNRAENLKWMSAEENKIHQSKSPYVIEEKEQRIHTPRDRNSNSKLTVTKVMLIKKLIKEGKTAVYLARHFKVSEMQIHRIKTGENWKHIRMPD
ncbi:MAG: HNH endonuclease [Edaphocola sp.]